MFSLFLYIIDLTETSGQKLNKTVHNSFYVCLYYRPEDKPLSSKYIVKLKV